jgi:hypothetical protein
VNRAIVYRFTILLVGAHVTVKLREHVQRRELSFPAFLLQWFAATVAAIDP